MSTIPPHMRPLFWDVNLDEFDAAAYPQYTIERILEHGDEAEVAWLVRHFTREHIRDVLRTDARLSARFAQFWALVFALPAEWAGAADALASRSVIEGFYLGGGTGLALQFGHRRSGGCRVFRELGQPELPWRRRTRTRNRT